MRQSFTISFKKQAVEKALNRLGSTTLEEVADTLSVDKSTLGRWIKQSKEQTLETLSLPEMSATATHLKEKRPQDWPMEDRLDMVISCASLSEEEVNENCRQKGIYPHHVKQWKSEFIKTKIMDKKKEKQREIKELKDENKALKMDLNRKDKALAETAALLVLQKKVNAIWGNGGDNLS